MREWRYVLNETNSVVPINDAATWRKWMASTDRVIDRTEKNGIVVITIFVGVDMSISDAGPFVFETIVAGGDLDGKNWRYASQPAAKRGHKEVCRMAFK